MFILSTIDNIITLLKEQNKTQKELCDYLGITKNAFTDWKSGRIKSYTKHLPQIAEFFNVSVDFLLGKSNQKEKKPSAESEELIQRLLNGDSNKMQILMSGGDGLKIIEIPEESKETVIRMLEALDKKNHD